MHKTEKSFRLAETGVYTFLGDLGDSIQDLSKFLKESYSAEIASYRVLTTVSKEMRIRGTRRTYRTKSYKKFMVKLKDDKKIEEFTKI